MNNHNHGDIVEEAAATLGPWQVFLAARRAEIEAQIAQMQASPLASVVPSMATHVALSPASAPPSITTEAGETEVASEAEVHPDNQGEEEPDAVPDTAAPPPTLAEAQAHFETLLSEVNLVLLPRQLREAHRHRTQNPQGFAQVLIGAKEKGYVPKTLAVAIEGMSSVDPHFMDAYRLYQSGKFSALFEINLDEEEADNETESATEASGVQADRAAVRNEDAV